MMEETKFRMKFEKKGDVRFISHLDMTRAFHRAFLRAGIRLKFSEGFSPHPKFSFLLPLSVGMESECEICDFTAAEKISPEEIKSNLRGKFPAGINVLSVGTGERPNLAFADYEIFIPGFPKGEKARLEKEFSTSVKIRKRTKKGGEKEIDLVGGIKSIAFSETDDGLLIKCTLPASGSEYLNPEFIAEYTAPAEKYDRRITRKAIKDENGNII